MEGQVFLMTIAGLAVSLAGFAGIIAALRGQLHTWSPMDIWRFKTIVHYAFGVVLISLMLVPVFDSTGSQDATIRVGSAALVILNVDIMLRNRRRDPEIWPSVAGHRVGLAIAGTVALSQVVNLWSASLWVFEVGLVLAVFYPVSVFRNFVIEIGRNPTNPG